MDGRRPRCRKARGDRTRPTGRLIPRPAHGLPGGVGGPGRRVSRPEGWHHRDAPPPSVNAAPRIRVTPGVTPVRPLRSHAPIPPIDGASVRRRGTVELTLPPDDRVRG